MDLSFIKLMVESYYNDSKKVQSIYPSKRNFMEDLYPEIESILSTCRLEDMDTYLELYNDYDKRQQQKILYTLIEYSLYDRYPNEFPLYETDYDALYDKILLNESVLGILSGGSVFLTALSALLLLTQTTPFSKIKWSILAKFQAVNEKIHKVIKDATKKSRVRLALTFNNAEECYQKCNIRDKKDLSNFINGGFRQSEPDDNLLNFETGKAREQAHCLTTCYLHWSVNQVQLLLQSYLTCLRSTGERNMDMSDLEMVLNTAPSSAICDPYFKLLKEHRNKYDDVLDVVCKDSIEQEEFERLYHNAINTAIQNSKKVNAHPEYRMDNNTFTKKSNPSNFKNKNNYNNNYKDKK